ncbi:MAG: DUF3024 domain-containing protein [Anaerolineae bacterium]|jgi:hypothetical protein
MAFSENELRKHKTTLDAFMAKRRPPEHLRGEVDLDYRIHRQSIEILERRAAWNRPGEITETPIAKTTYLRTQNKWKVYWQRSDLKWHGYEPRPEVDSLSDFLNVVDADEYGCFWG